MPENATPNPNQNQNPNQPQNPASTPAPVFSLDAFLKDKKLTETIKIFAIYGTLLYVANALVAMVIISLTWFPYGGFLSIGALIMAAVKGAVFSAIGGIFFYYLYARVHNWIKKNAFVSKYIHSMFTLFWIPFLVSAIITFVFSLIGMLPLLGIGYGAYGAMGYMAVGGMSVTGLLVGIIIGFAARVVIYYYYSKAISAKLSPMYPW